MGISTAISAIGWLCLLSTYCLANQNPPKKFDFPVQEFVYSHETYTAAKNIFAGCKKNDGSDERQCRVATIKDPASKDTQECNVHLKLNHRKGQGNKNTDMLAIAPLGKSHAVFYLIEEGKNANVKFNIINMNDCKVIENEISVVNPDTTPKKAVIVVPYDDCFDVFYRDPAKCGEKGFCKITINAEGKTVNGPDTAIDSNLYLSTPPYIVPVSTQSKDKGFFYLKPVEGSANEFDFTLQKPGGHKKSLGKYKVFAPKVISTSHDLISACFVNDQANPISKCMQWDSEGNLKFQMNTESNTVAMHAYNLLKGGLLLFAAKRDKPSAQLNEMDFSVIKTDHAGKKVGAFKIGKMNFQSGIKDIILVPSFYMNKDHKYCLLVTQYKSTDSGLRSHEYVESINPCFNDDDFKN